MAKSKSKSKSKANEKFNTKGFDKSKGKGRDKSPSKQPNSNVTDDIKGNKDSGPSKMDCNDMEWLFPDPNILKNVCDISMQSILGMPFDLSSRVNGVVNDYALTFPSVMGIKLYPSVGVQDDTNLYVSGLNQEGRRAYNLYSMVSNRTTQYQPQDIELATISVGQLLMLSCTAIKILGLAFAYNSRNRTIPRVLIKAMHCDPDSILGQDLAGLRDDFNQIMMACNSIMMPDNIKYFSECREWFLNYFMDSDSMLGQYYITYPGGYWLLDETGSQGGELVFKYICESAGPSATDDEYTFRNLLDAIIEVRDTLLGSSLMQKVFTDTVKYASEKGGKLVGFGTVPSMYLITPKYNQEFLHILHNASSLGAPDKSSMNVTQSVLNNILVHTPTWKSRTWKHNIPNQSVIDFQFTDNPDAKEKGQAFLWKVVPNSITVESDGTYTYNVRQLPTFYPVLFTIWDSETVNTAESTTHHPADAGWDLFDIKLEKFRDHPINYLYNANTNALIYVSGDLNFYDCIEESKVKRFWDSAYLGLFNVIDAFGDITTKGHD